MLSLTVSSPPVICCHYWFAIAESSRVIFPQKNRKDERLVGCGRLASWYVLCSKCADFQELCGENSGVCDLGQLIIRPGDSPCIYRLPLAVRWSALHARKSATRPSAPRLRQVCVKLSCVPLMIPSHLSKERFRSIHPPVCETKQVSWVR